MKKLFSIICLLLAFTLTTKAQLATSSLQTISNSYLDQINNKNATTNYSLDYLKAKQDTVNQNLRSVRAILNGTAATAANQTASTATLTIISNSLTTISNTLNIVKQKQDTVNQNLRALNTLNTTQNSTLTIIKQKQDTVNQNLRSIYNRLDTAQRYITVTYTWTSPSTFTPVNGYWATSSTSPMTTFSVALPTGTWKITNVILTNSIFMPLNFFIFSSPFTMGENNSVTNANVANLSKTIGVFDGVSAFTGQLNGYIGGYNSSTFVKPVAVRNAIYFAAAYRATTPCNNVTFYVTFTLEK